MKKIFSFFAVAALMGMMISCGNSESAKDQNETVKIGKDGITAKNKINDNDSDVLKVVKITDQLINIMNQEPSAEGYEYMMNTAMMMSTLDMQNLSDEEIDKVAAEFDPKYANKEAMDKMMEDLQKKWTKWAEEHQDEAMAITLKAMAAMSDMDETEEEAEEETEE